MNHIEQYQSLIRKMKEDGYPPGILDQMVDHLISNEKMLMEQRREHTKQQHKIQDYEKQKAMARKLQLRDDLSRPLLEEIREYLVNVPQTEQVEQFRQRIKKVLG